MEVDDAEDTRDESGAEPPRGGTGGGADCGGAPAVGERLSPGRRCSGLGGRTGRSVSERLKEGRFETPSSLSSSGLMALGESPAASLMSWGLFMSGSSRFGSQVRGERALAGMVVEEAEVARTGCALMLFVSNLPCDVLLSERGERLLLPEGVGAIMGNITEPCGMCGGVLGPEPVGEG